MKIKKIIRRIIQAVVFVVVVVMLYLGGIRFFPPTPGQCGFLCSIAVLFSPVLSWKTEKNWF